jgi:ABC-type branched-subunit amino acid transport system substrate-binding protein
MKSRVTSAVIAVALVAGVLGACTSKSSDSTSSVGSSGSAAPAQGVTDDEITISLIYSDLSVLSEQHLAPEIGDAGKTVEAIANDINAKGGIGGRKLKIVPHVVNGADAILNADLGRQICVKATEDDKPFAVIIAAAIPAPVVKCSAVDHQVLTIAMDSWPQSLYDQSQGRLFSVGSNISVSSTRLYTAWPTILQDKGALTGKTVGIIRTDGTDQAEAVDAALKPSLDAIGVKVGAEAILPCPEGSQTCEQQDAAIQRMRDANVDVLFLVAQNLAGAATVAAAEKVGYKPQWTTVGNNVTDTSANFYVASKDNYDGAIGLSVAFTDETQQAAECNQIATAGGAQAFPSGSDGFNFTGLTCLQLQILTDAIGKVQGSISTDAVSTALVATSPVQTISGPVGSFTPDKRDAGNAVLLATYDASAGKFVVDTPATPIMIP